MGLYLDKIPSVALKGPFAQMCIKFDGYLGQPKSKIENIEVRGRIGMATSGMESCISLVFRKIKKFPKNRFSNIFFDL